MRVLLEEMVDVVETRKQPIVKMTQFNTVIGSMTAGATDEGICLLEFSDSDKLLSRVNRLKQRLGKPFVSGRHKYLTQLKKELKLYLSGSTRQFDVPLALNGTTFQLTVWDALLRLNYGQTLTYSELASLTGKTDAVRATAAANGANPISILIPCHRIKGANGNLTGYGGGLERKAWLLDLESANHQ